MMFIIMFIMMSIISMTMPMTMPAIFGVGMIVVVISLPIDFDMVFLNGKNDESVSTLQLNLHRHAWL